MVLEQDGSWEAVAGSLQARPRAHAREAICRPLCKDHRRDTGSCRNRPGRSGKEPVLQEANFLLIGAGIPHATVELEDIARYWGPRPAEQRTRPDVAYQNLAAIWGNYSAAGADRLLLSLLMERQADLDPVHKVIPDARITVVRLHAPLAVIEERLRSREIAARLEEELSAARWWVSRLEGSTFADYVVDTGSRPPRQAAAEVLRTLGWLD